MSHLAQILHGVMIFAGYLLGAGFLLWQLLRRSEAPLTMFIRLIATVPVIAAMVYAGRTFETQYQSGSPASAMVVLYAAVAGVVLMFIWVPAITFSMGQFFSSFYDGGNQQAIPKPFYSVFRTSMTRGKYAEALAEVRRQLAKFPTDFEGHMLLSELQAKHLDDLPGADLTILRVCSQTKHSDSDKSFALNQLADWYLDITKDRDSARRTLERIMELMPGSEMAHRAAQRIGHLAKDDTLLASNDRQPIEAKKGVRDLGLLRGTDGRLKAPTVDLDKQAGEFVTHLEQHPMDTEVREKLAVLYAKHFHRLDLAIEQLELLAQFPGMATKKIVHWLNLKADLQVAEGDSEENIRATLQRIVEGYPDQASSENAYRRLQTVRLELNATSKSKQVKLGTYEQDIGLKSGPRRRG